MDEKIRNEIIKKFGSISHTKSILSILKNWVTLILLAFFSTYIIKFNLLIYIAYSFIIACALRGFDNLTHEASHDNLFKFKKNTLLVDLFICFPVFKTLKGYKRSHMLHHRYYRKNPNKDPDTIQSIRWGVNEKNKKNYKLVYFYLFRLFTFYYVIDNIKYNLIPNIKSRDVFIPRIIFWILIIFFFFITSSWDFLIFGYLIPVLYWLPFIRFVTESSEHNNLDLSSQYSNSRNNIGLFHRILLHPHNDGYHQMHHLIASIPSYNLKRAYNYLKEKKSISDEVIESFSPIETAKQVFNKN